MHRRVFVQRSVSSRSIIVAGVAAQHASKMRLAKDNDVVQAFTANGPNQSFGIPVLPRRTRCNRCVPNSHGMEAPPRDRSDGPVRGADAGVQAALWLHPGTNLLHLVRLGRTDLPSD